MDGFITIMEMIFNFMNKPIMTLHVGEFAGSITFMQLLIGTAVANVGIWFVKAIFLE